VAINPFRPDRRILRDHELFTIATGKNSFKTKKEGSKSLKKGANIIINVICIKFNSNPWKAIVHIRPKYFRFRSSLPFEAVFSTVITLIRVSLPNNDSLTQHTYNAYLKNTIKHFTYL
jgi:hypothetical protein